MFTELRSKLKKIYSFDVVSHTIDIINENSEYLSDLLREQLSAGKDSKGNDVLLNGNNYYTDSTILKKERYGVGLGKETNWITNYMSGAFYSSIYVAAIGREFIFDSAIEYFDKIIERSGEVIMDLNKENLEKFSTEILQPKLKEIYSNYLNGV